MVNALALKGSIKQVLEGVNLRDLRAFALITACVAAMAAFARLSAVDGVGLPWVWPPIAIGFVLMLSGGLRLLAPACLGIALASANEGLMTMGWAVAELALPILLSVEMYRGWEGRKPARGHVDRLLRLWGASIGVAVPFASGLSTLSVLLGPDIEISAPSYFVSHSLMNSTTLLMIVPWLGIYLGAQNRFNERIQFDRWGLAGGVTLSLAALGLLLQGWDHWASISLFLFYPLLLAVAVRAKAREGLPVMAFLSVCVLLIRGVTVYLYPQDAIWDHALTCVALIQGIVTFQLVQFYSEDRRLQASRLARLMREYPATAVPNERALAESIDRGFREGAATHGFGLIEVQLVGLEASLSLMDRSGEIAVQRAVAARLRQRLLGQADCVAQLSPTRYALMTRGIDESGLTELAKSLYKGFNQAVMAVAGDDGDTRLVLHASVGGLYVCVPGALSAEECLGALALVQKNAARSASDKIQVAEYSDGLVAAQRERQSLMEFIKQLVREMAFELYAQPIVAAKFDPKSKSGLHYEVLCRMSGPDGKPLPPTISVPLLASAGLSRELDRAVARKVFWSLSKDPVLWGATASCSVNLSAASLSDPDLSEWILNEIRHAGLKPDRFIFEITESEFIPDMDVALVNLHTMMKAGLRTSIDDFGTGMATFSYVKRFPAQYLKIDGSFVKEAEDSGVDRQIIRSVVGLAREVGAMTVAEQVESESVAQRLADMGVDWLQGYFLGKPMPLNQMIHWTDPRRMMRPADRASAKSHTTAGSFRSTEPIAAEA